jgi:prepilin-type N-terminal cleavage/methylation domain-containing protein
MKNRQPNNQERAFTLLELLVVLAITAVLIGAGIPALSAFNAGQVNQAVYTVSDTLEQARTYAMSMNTYVYVGIVQDGNSSNSGSLVMGIIASNDGTQIFSASNSNLSQNPTSYKTISKLIRINNVQAVSLPSTSQTSGDSRPVVPDSYKMGDPTFAQTNPNYSFSSGAYNFTSTPGPTTVQNVTSEGMLQIDPQGVASEVGGSVAPFFEIGLQSVKGNQSNYAAVQIAGLSGSVRIYRP